jgi:hypothetical protein
VRVTHGGMVRVTHGRNLVLLLGRDVLLLLRKHRHRRMNGAHLEKGMKSSIYTLGKASHVVNVPVVPAFSCATSWRGYLVVTDWTFLRPEFEIAWVEASLGRRGWGSHLTEDLS